MCNSDFASRRLLAAIVNHAISGATVPERHRAPTLTEDDVIAAIPDGGLPSLDALEGWGEPVQPVGRETID